jgi:hydroxymethylglutaryl-CoA lyase
VAVFTAASEPFTRANINMTISESIAAFRPVVERARERGWWSRGYVSTAFGCPYQGEVGEAAVVAVARQLVELGVDEVSIGDTIGVAGPADVRRVVNALLRAGIGAERLAMHFHDTRGTALANVSAALELGIRCFDSSSGGTGGCPYAPGAAGNLATEDLVYLLGREGMKHGVQLDGVLNAARYISEVLGRPLATKVGQAGGWQATGA